MSVYSVATWDITLRLLIIILIPTQFISMEKRPFERNREGAKMAVEK